ncbi:alpha/beta fold hydrolase [Algibacter luteus]|uniref:Pimeloyl-ACP methyl ester carboxylesterase n=1 Tax=Algibacter luteus TaxID=1178825 RepID=A0A1M6AZ19_9FLAO|nr:alpha/beta hydrolase [Algibacter luteus]SHI41558.1 Pimeloyl-ACP methyl ester carboxylesterase [Algibacter luteus]
MNKYLTHKGISVFYTDHGSGNAIVLLHGFLENASMWEPFIKSLSKTNRVICIDLLGHGKTGCLGYVHSIELMAEAVNAVLKHLKIKHSSFIGHSMGGYVTLAFAEQYPDAVNGLCLMNSTAEDDTLEKKANRDRAILAVKQNHKTFIRIAITNLFRPKNRTIYAEKIKGVIQEAQLTPLQGIVAALEGMKIRKNRTELLRKLPCKKMLIVGKKDPVLDYKSLKDQTKTLDVEWVEFPDGHMSHIENKDEFLHRIVHFIEK